MQHRLRSGIAARWAAPVLGMALSGMVLAQSGAPPAAQATTQSTSADSSKLPGDNPPPSGMMAGPPPTASPGAPQGGANGKPPQEPGSDAPSPALKLAVEAAQAAVDACLADGYKVGVAVIDSSGQPRAALTADGATGGHIYTAVRKGLAAVAFNLPTSQVQSLLANDKNAATRVTPSMATMAGAVPLLVNGKAIGAIGVSGASSQQDEKCAIAAEARIHARLK